MSKFDICHHCKRFFKVGIDVETVVKQEEDYESVTDQFGVNGYIHSVYKCIYTKCPFCKKLIYNERMLIKHLRAFNKEGKEIPLAWLI